MRSTRGLAKHVMEKWKYIVSYLVATVELDNGIVMLMSIPLIEFRLKSRY